MSRIATLLAVVLLSACKTPCQQLCVEMAAYAEECGVTVPDAQLQSCLDDQSSDQDQGACRRTGDPETLRSEWSCDDVEVFFQ